MQFGAILLLAVGLAMDATAVAAARGMATEHVRARDVVLVALLFGGFQAGMPLLGWLAGHHLGRFVEAWDHWVIFVLLGGIGLKMLWEARGGARTAEGSDLFALRALVLMAVATSLDALAAGLTLPMMHAPMGLALATIGVTTAILSAAGVLAGRRFGALLGRRLDIVGGLVLIALATKILLEHLLA